MASKKFTRAILEEIGGSGGVAGFWKDAGEEVDVFNGVGGVESGFVLVENAVIVFEVLQNNILFQLKGSRILKSLPKISVSC